MEEQIRHVDVGRVSRLYHRRRWRANVRAASRIVVVIVVINVRGGGTSGNAHGADDGGGGGGNGVSRPWRWRGRLSKLSRPQSRTVGPGIGATG